jgi:hypothetical protein
MPTRIHNVRNEGVKSGAISLPGIIIYLLGPMLQGGVGWASVPEHMQGDAYACISKCFESPVHINGTAIVRGGGHVKGDDVDVVRCPDLVQVNSQSGMGFNLDCASEVFALFCEQMDWKIWVCAFSFGVYPEGALQRRSPHRRSCVHLDWLWQG